MLAAEPLDIRDHHPAAFADDDQSSRDFAHQVLLEADHGCIGDIRMAHDDLLDLHWAHPVPANLEDLLGPTAVEEETVRVAVGQVTCPQPAVPENRRCLLGFIEVSARDVLASRHQMSFLLGRQLLAELVDHPQLDSRDGNAD